MTIVAGFSAARQSRAPIDLAAQLAETSGEPIIAVAVVEERWPPQYDPVVEREYIDHVCATAERALQNAIETLPGGTDVRGVARAATSIPSGLTDFAAEQGASVVVVGSSSAGLLGRIALGSVTNRVVHTGSIPIAIAPRGYVHTEGPIRRLTAAFGRHADVNGLIPAAAELARRWGATLRITSFTARDIGAFITSDADTESMVVKRWWQRTQEAIAEQLDAVRTQVDVDDVQVTVGIGHDWQSAVESIAWGPGDLLLLGSGAAGPTRQVFLGSAAAKILRHCPVPVMIVPRP